MGCAAACLSNNHPCNAWPSEAAVHADIMLLRQAMMMDPLVGAVCNPPEIWQMVDEMLIAEPNGCPSTPTKSSAPSSAGPRPKPTAR